MLPISPASAPCRHPLPLQRWPSVLRRGLLLALVWWILTGGETASWWVGAPAVLLAATISVQLLPPLNLVWHELFGFVPFFLARSLLGGADVAWRAFHPRMPIAPDLIEYPMRLPPGLPSVFMANTVSLLPGTLSTRLSSNRLRVHVLKPRKNTFSELATVERRVAAVFGLSLGDEAKPGRRSAARDRTTENNGTAMPEE